MAESTLTNPLLPPHDLTRALALAQADSETAPHIGLVGDTYAHFHHVRQEIRGHGAGQGRESHNSEMR
jgi:hypothetical protein